MSDVRPHLGAGWPFPVRLNRGRLELVKYEDRIEQSIQVILETARNERVMLPEFGAGLRTFLFSSNSALTRGQIESDVRSALVRWEPRISVERVQARSSSDTPNLILVEIDYVIKRTSAFYNRVYPFYLAQPLGS